MNGKGHIQTVWHRTRPLGPDTNRGRCSATVAKQAASVIQKHSAQQRQAARAKAPLLPRAPQSAGASHPPPVTAHSVKEAELQAVVACSSEGPC